MVQGIRTLIELTELVFREDLQEYGYVTANLGNCRLQVHCYDGKSRMARIRGKMHKKVWINNNDTVLVALREFEDDKADVILKYNDDEVRRLRILKELPDMNKFDGEGNRSDREDGGNAFEFDIMEI